uniref:Glucoside xylosyltransferase 1 n=1 Tax=Monopterus albus TaxID=43700 RepID=A0A3Q3K537_MONAL
YAVGGSVQSRPPMHLTVMACGERLEETVTMIKSAMFFSIKHLNFHVFVVNDQLEASVSATCNLKSWPVFIQSRFNCTFYSISFPRENAADWKKLFKPCASERLFLPLILKDINLVLYVDSDILFLQPVDHLWAFLAQFNSSQLAAMAPEHEEPHIAYTPHPFYSRTGVNSGVMLMNMMRIRNTFFKNDMTSVGLRWEELLMPLLQKYKSPCWNFHASGIIIPIIYGSNCGSAEEDGIYILHENRWVYHDHKLPAFRAVYKDQLEQQTHMYLYCAGTRHIRVNGIHDI